MLGHRVTNRLFIGTPTLVFPVSYRKLFYVLFIWGGINNLNFPLESSANCQTFLCGDLYLNVGTAVVTTQYIVFLLNLPVLLFHFRAVPEEWEQAYVFRFQQRNTDIWLNIERSFFNSRGYQPRPSSTSRAMQFIVNKKVGKSYSD